jgi:hypothetical protein
MSTNIQPHHDQHESDAQSLLVWLGTAMLVVTGLIVVAIVALGATAGMVLAYGGLIVAVIAVFAYIMRFIGPEDH